MPRYVVNITASGWFEITADDEDDAAKVASEFTSGGVPIGADFEWCEVESIEREDD